MEVYISLQLFFWGIAIGWLAMTGATLFHLHWAQRLPSLGKLKGKNPDTHQDRNAPPLRVSIVIPARNEAARLEDALRRLLAQHEVLVEIIAVDDRSTDRTGEILRHFASKDQRVKARWVEVLPAGWLGKCHACYLGAAMATGDWILFTDADCWLSPDVLVRALRVAERERADHVSLTPGIAGVSVGAQAWHLNFLMSLAGWLAGVNRDQPKRYFGLGAFNLMRATTYRACGGYEALRLTVLDDIKLGLLLRRAGGRTRAFLGGVDAECHWGTTVREMMRILEKNYFAAVDYRTAPALGTVLIGCVGWLGALIGPLTGTMAGIGSGLGLLSWTLPAAVCASRLGWPRPVALLVPFLIPALLWAFLRSTVVTLRNGGIRWRETFYPLAELRQGNVR